MLVPERFTVEPEVMAVVPLAALIVSSPAEIISVAPVDLTVEFTTVSEAEVIFTVPPLIAPVVSRIPALVESSTAFLALTLLNLVAPVPAR